MLVMGFDPSLCNWGWVLAEHHTGTLQIWDMGTIRVTPVKGKRPNETLYVRAQSLYSELAALPYAGVATIYAEAPTGSQSATARDSYAACISLLAVIGLSTPIKIVRPLEVKAATGNRKAEKRDMVQWATTRYPHEKWKVRGGEYCLNNEHQADALAAIVAGIGK